MLTDIQAEKIGDVILTEQKRLQFEEKNSKARRVPWYYRCPELVSLQPWQREEIMIAAKQKTRDAWPIYLGSIVWVVSGALLWIFVLPRELRQGFGIILTCVELAGPPAILRFLVTRKNIRETASGLQTKWSSR